MSMTNRQGCQCQCCSHDNQECDCVCHVAGLCQSKEPKSMNKYEPTAEQKKRIDNNFTYHSPKDDQPERYEDIRGAARFLANVIICNTPTSREQSLALTELENAIMWANASIARNE